MPGCQTSAHAPMSSTRILASRDMGSIARAAQPNAAQKSQRVSASNPCSSVRVHSPRQERTPRPRSQPPDPCLPSPTLPKGAIQSKPSSHPLTTPPPPFCCIGTLPFLVNVLHILVMLHSHLLHFGSGHIQLQLVRSVQVGSSEHPASLICCERCVRESPDCLCVVNIGVPLI